jgi:hypothetical protein
MKLFKKEFSLTVDEPKRRDSSELLSFLSQPLREK